MSWRKDTWLVAAALAVSAVLQFGAATSNWLWTDELFSLAIATGHSLEHPASAADPGLGDFIEGSEPRTREVLARYLDPADGSTAPGRVIRAAFLSDTSPPLYYALLGLWIRIFGAGDLGVRSFSIVCALACIPFIADLARRTAGRPMVGAACVLFALSPITVYYGSEARMYGLLWLCATAMAWAGWRARTARRRLGLLIVWAAVSAAGFLTHYFFIFPWAAVTGCLLLWPGRLRRLEIVAAGGAIVLAILPWYLRLPESLNNWRVTQGWLNLEPAGYSHPKAIWEQTSQFFTGQLRDLWRIHRKAKILALAVTLALVLAAFWRLKGQPMAPRRMLPALWFAAVLAGPFVFDFLQGTYTAAVPRYTLAALPAACLLLSLALGCFTPWLRWGLLILLLTAWAPCHRSILNLKTRSGFPIHEVVRLVGNKPTQEDIVIVHSIPSGVLGVARYYQGNAPIIPWVGQLGTRSVPESIESMVDGRKRIYLIRIHDVGQPAPELDWLRENANLESEEDWGAGGGVYEFLR